MTQSRPLSVIAQEISENWKPVHEWAQPYLEAMATLNSINDNYFEDSASSVVVYFLSNATSWRGDKAREIKAELKAMLK